MVDLGNGKSAPEIDSEQAEKQVTATSGPMPDSRIGCGSTVDDQDELTFGETLLEVVKLRAFLDNVLGDDESREEPKRSPGLRQDSSIEDAPSRLRRSLDIDDAIRSAHAIDARLELLNDFSRSIFQGWLDSLAGQACPRRADNERLVELIMDRASQFGLHLYAQFKGSTVRVKLIAGPPTSPMLLAPDSPAAIAGSFVLNNIKDPSAPTSTLSGKLTAKAKLPRLIVARTLEQAEQLFESSQKSGSNTVEVSRPLDPPRPDLDSWSLSC
ncbi:MAG: hypothetical protein GC190_19945 [Alphaproteobacteria bacterium]|nr:hypothetical protein [Alphaproteobacteria bacterium]